MVLVWNLFQRYAATNKVQPMGKVEKEGPKLTVPLQIPQRLGQDMTEDPVVNELKLLGKR